MADKKAKAKADPAKDKAAGKDKKSKKGKGEDGPVGISVAGHPRAGGYVRRAKGWGGLVGFAIAAYLSLQAAVPIATAGERALIAGVAGYLVAWACSVTVWRHLVLAELRHQAEQVQAKRAEAATQAPGTI